jgi:hypothetical protein
MISVRVINGCAVSVELQPQFGAVTTDPIAVCADALLSGIKIKTAIKNTNL